MQPNDPNQQPVANPMPQQQPVNNMVSTDPTTGNPVQTAAPVQTAQPAYTSDCYYMPNGKRTAFSAKKGRADVYLGLLIITDAATNQEVRRWPLQGTVVNHVMGSCQIRAVNGQKLPLISGEAQIYFYNPIYLLISYWFMILNAKKSKLFFNALMQAGAVKK